MVVAQRVVRRALVHIWKVVAYLWKVFVVVFSWGNLMPYALVVRNKSMPPLLGGVLYLLL